MSLPTLTRGGQRPSSDNGHQTTSTTLRCGQHEITVSLRQITPALAAQWLERNTANRNLRPRGVLEIATAIQAGHWVVNGETIVFDRAGNLVDGQHRLQAIVAGREPAVSLVVEGVERDPAWETTDTGRKRTLGDVLKRRGYKDPNNLSSMLRFVALIERAQDSGEPSDRGGEVRHRQLALLEENADDLVAALTVGRRVRDSGLVGTPAFMGALAFHLHRTDVEEADAFFASLISGEGLTEGNPILVLRRTLISERAKPKERRVPPVVLVALTIKAWNAWLDGREIKQLAWKRGGRAKESFPKIDRPEAAA